MVLIADFTYFPQKVHVVYAAKFVFIEESYEPVEFCLGNMLNDFHKHIEQFLCRDLADVWLVLILQELNNFFFFGGVYLGVHFLEDCVAVVNGFKRLSREVSYQIADWNQSSIIFDSGIDGIYLYVWNWWIEVSHCSVESFSV